MFTFYVAKNSKGWSVYHDKGNVMHLNAVQISGRTQHTDRDSAKAAAVKIGVAATLCGLEATWPGA